MIIIKPMWYSLCDTACVIQFVWSASVDGQLHAANACNSFQVFNNAIINQKDSKCIVERFRQFESISIDSMASRHLRMSGLHQKVSLKEEPCPAFRFNKAFPAKSVQQRYYFEQKNLLDRNIAIP